MRILAIVAIAASLDAQSTLLQSWQGDVGTYVGTTPTYGDRPDNGLAAGPTQIAQLTGQDFSLYDRSGNLLQRIATSGSSGFFGNAGGGYTTRCSDPRIYFDPFIGASGRFIAVCTDGGGKGNYYCVSAGTDGTSNTTPNYQCNTIPNTGSGDDTMRVGYDVNGVIICIYNGTCYAFTNSALAWTGSSPPGTYSGSVTSGNLETFPAVDLNASKASNAPNVILSRTGPAQTGTNATLNILAIKLTWSGSTPTFSSTTTITSPSWLYNTPINGDQPGSPSTYYLQESHRPVPPTWDASGKVWTIFQSGPCASSCGSLPSNGKTGFYWVQIDPVALTIAQSGYQFTTNSLSFQSIATTSDGVTHIITEYSNPSGFISLAEYYRLSTDTAGTLRGPYVQVAGTTTYPLGCSGNPLGVGVSYNTGVLDYYNQATMWATGEIGVSPNSCQWTTQVLQLSLPSSSSVGTFRNGETIRSGGRIIK